MKPVAIIGGGLAGLAAATQLAKKGVPVTLFEKRPFCGGRTFSFKKDFWPHPIDNGPHVLMGCYAATLAFLGTIGRSSRLSVQKRLSIPFLLRGGRKVWLRATFLPAPLHLLSGLGRFPLLSARDVRPIIRAVWQLRRRPDAQMLDEKTVAQWLDETLQTQAARAFFWEPLTLATLNASPAKVSLLQLYRVLQIGFFQGKRESRLLFMPQGLSAALVTPAVEWLRARRVQILFRQNVHQIVAPENRPAQVVLSGGTPMIFDKVISAVPVQVFRRIFFPSDEKQERLLRSLDSFSTSAILNFHFWYSGTITQHPMTALVHRTGQWLFRNKSHDGITHCTVVISGANDLLHLGKEAIADRLLQELEELLPGFTREKIQHSYLTVEKNATLACYPGTESKRPLPGMQLGNVILAGDWTQTGLPPTIESAIVSGYQAAAKALPQE